ncbi:MAG: hypothetical protein PUP93_07195 [Rhizonema sp. NSF051]|nr:hypothetical protein [Rhizonema sp. NSF051]
MTYLGGWLFPGGVCDSLAGLWSGFSSTIAIFSARVKNYAYRVANTRISGSTVGYLRDIAETLKQSPSPRCAVSVNLTKVVIL